MGILHNRKLTFIIWYVEVMALVPTREGILLIFSLPHGMKPCLLEMTANEKLTCGKTVYHPIPAKDNTTMVILYMYIDRIDKEKTAPNVIQLYIARNKIHIYSFIHVLSLLYACLLVMGFVKEKYIRQF